MTSVSVLFHVEGPFEIPFESPNPGLAKIITGNHGRDFWKNPDVAEFATSRGCYVFGLRAGRGFSPWYVGKATKSFKQEVFGYHKLHMYNKVGFAGHKGTPVLWFVVRPGKSSKAAAVQIDEVETYLIQAAVQKNPALTNSHKVIGPPWGIRGIVRGGKGKPSDAASQFRGMMGIDSPRPTTRIQDSVQSIHEAVTRLSDDPADYVDETCHS